MKIRQSPKMALWFGETIGKHSAKEVFSEEGEDG